VVTGTDIITKKTLVRVEYAYGKMLKNRLNQSYDSCFLYNAQCIYLPPKIGSSGNLTNQSFIKTFNSKVSFIDIKHFV